MKKVICVLVVWGVLSWACVSSAWEIVNYTKINGVSFAISEEEDSIRTQLIESQVSLVHGDGKTIAVYYDKDTASACIVTYRRGIVALIER